MTARPLPQDIADVVTWIAGQPPHVVIADVIVYPLAQAGSGKIARSKR